MLKAITRKVIVKKFVDAFIAVVDGLLSGDAADF